MKKLESQTEHWLPIVGGKIYFTPEMLQPRLNGKRTNVAEARQKHEEFKKEFHFIPSVADSEFKLRKGKHDVKLRNRIKAHFPFPKSLSKTLAVNVKEYLSEDMIIEVYHERQISQMNNAIAWSVFHVVDISENHVKLVSYLSFDNWKKSQKNMTKRMLALTANWHSESSSK